MDPFSFPLADVRSTIFPGGAFSVLDFAFSNSGTDFLFFALRARRTPEKGASASPLVAASNE